MISSLGKNINFTGSKAKPNRVLALNQLEISKIGHFWEIICFLKDKQI
jgi:hypothetical protein